MMTRLEQHSIEAVARAAQKYYNQDTAFVKSVEVLPVLMSQAKDKDYVSYKRLLKDIDVKVIRNLNRVG